MRTRRLAVAAAATMFACTSMLASTAVAQAQPPAAGAASQPAAATPAAAPAKATMSREARVFAATALRAKASTSSKILRVIPANSFIRMDSAKAPRSWLRVVVDGRTGYVMSKYAEGPWIGQREPGDSRIQPVSAAQQKKIIELGL